MIVPYSIVLVFFQKFKNQNYANDNAMNPIVVLSASFSMCPTLTTAERKLAKACLIEIVKGKTRMGNFIQWKDFQLVTMANAYDFKQTRPL